jgi:hypothetical protein
MDMPCLHNAETDTVLKGMVKYGPYGTQNQGRVLKTEATIKQVRPSERVNKQQLLMTRRRLIDCYVVQWRCLICNLHVFTASEYHGRITIDA